MLYIDFVPIIVFEDENLYKIINLYMVDSTRHRIKQVVTEFILKFHSIQWHQFGITRGHVFFSFKIRV